MYFKLYKKIKNRLKILKKDKIKIFLAVIQEEKSLSKILFDWDIYKLYMSDNILNRFLKSLSKFINNIDITQIEKQDLIKIINIFLNMLLTYYKFLHFNQIAVKSSRHKSKREKFLISSVRILEFTLFLAIQKNKKVKKFFLDDYPVFSYNQYFFYLKDLNESIQINYFAIYKNKTTNTNQIVVGFNKEDCEKSTKNEELKKKIIDNSYKSFIKTQSFEKDITNYFKYYMHLEDQMVSDFYDYKEIKVLDSAGGKRRKIVKQEFTIIEEDKIEYISLGKDENIKKFSNEIQKEIKMKNNILLSPLVDKNTALLIKSNLLVNKPLKVKIDSKFKRYMIGKAISNSITKRNLDISQYQIPEIEQLKSFIAFLYAKDKLKTDLILLQIIFNASLEKLITGFINKNIIIDNNRFYMEYGNFFSKIDSEVKIFKKIKKGQKFYIYISEIIQIILQNFQINIIDTINEINADTKKTYIDNLTNELNDFIKTSKNEFNKTIALNIKTLPKLSFYYFKHLTKKSSINMLFAKDINKNDEARLCYCATLQRLITYESWILELIDKLEISKLRLKEKLNDIIPNDLQLEGNIGSYKILEREYFRIFLLNLERLIEKHYLTREDKINIQMIYLRYVLGLSLATRDFDNSCDLSNYSKKFKILLIQEKAKSIHMSKRIIPLTQRAIKNIEIFKNIRQKNNIKSNSPVLLIDGKEIAIKKAEMKKFFLKFEKYDYLKHIINFIESCRLNFGRHIATYNFANDNDVNEEYLDAFLGHFKMGNEDQGIFSYFNNREYIDTITSKMEKIEQYYLKNTLIFEERL